MTRFRKKRDGKFVRKRKRERKRERGGPGSNKLILERAQRHVPQFSDSKSWLTVREVELVRQLARRI